MSSQGIQQVEFIIQRIQQVGFIIQVIQQVGFIIQGIQQVGIVKQGIQQVGFIINIRNAANLFFIKLFNIPLKTIFNQKTKLYFILEISLNKVSFFNVKNSK